MYAYTYLSIYLSLSLSMCVCVHIYIYIYIYPQPCCSDLIKRCARASAAVLLLNSFVCKMSVSPIRELIQI